MTVITDDTVDLIKRWEGLRLDAYRDQAGVWTIGYGHSERSPLPPKPVAGMRITEDEADAIFRADIEHFAEEVRPLVPEDIPPHVFGAVVSLAFNIGIGAFKGSTARRRLEAGDVKGAAEALTWWNKVTVGGKKVVSRGLVNRRAAEKAFMLRHAPAGAPSVPVVEDAAPEPAPPVVAAPEPPPVEKEGIEKAVAAFVTSALGMFAAAGFEVPSDVSEIATGIGASAITALVVWYVRNSKKEA